MGPAIVSATVDIYQAIKRDLLPTPAKSHYTYNMRDLSKVFQGIAMVGVGVDTPEKMTRCAVLACGVLQPCSAIEMLLIELNLCAVYLSVCVGEHDAELASCDAKPCWAVTVTRTSHAAGCGHMRHSGSSTTVWSATMTAAGLEIISRQPCKSTCTSPLTRCLRHRPALLALAS